jgi:hypothetical protein
MICSKDEFQCYQLDLLLSLWSDFNLNIYVQVSALSLRFNAIVNAYILVSI